MIKKCHGISKEVFQNMLLIAIDSKEKNFRNIYDFDRIIDFINKQLRVKNEFETDSETETASETDCEHLPH